MKLTKRQLERIVKEAILFEYGYGMDDGLGNYPGDEGYSEMTNEWSYWGQKSCFQDAYEEALDMLEQDPTSDPLEDEEWKQEFLEAWAGEMPMAPSSEILDQWFEGTRQAKRDSV